MQIIEIELQNGRIFSPTNGELLYDVNTGLNMEAATLAGMWDNDVRSPYYEPFIQDYDIGNKWADHVNNVTLDNISEKDEDMKSYPDPEYFILDYDKDPSLLGIRLKLSGVKGSDFWIVVKMPGPVTIE